MKKISLTALAAILFYSSRSEAQPRFFPIDSAYVRTIEGLPSKQPFDTAHRYNKVKEQQVYIISDNDIYNLFGYNKYIELRELDFSKYHILGEERCEYCDATSYEHRNACDFKWVWVVRENQKAFVETPVIRTLGGRSFQQPKQKIKKPFYDDTVAFDGPQKDTATWYTHGGGDCHASFEYKLFKDKYRPVLLLKEYNYYGGCRAGGFWDFEISFLMPPAVKDFTKRTILMERRTGKF